MEGRLIPGPRKCGPSSFEREGMSEKADVVNVLDSTELQRFMQEHLPQLAPPKEGQPQGKRNICVALLSHDSKIYLRTMMSILSAVMQCGQRGWGITFMIREGDSMVARGRSFLASQFLENEKTRECTDLVFIDTDLTWNGEEFARLCSHDVDVVGGAYPFKNDGGDFPLRWPPHGLVEENGLWVVQATTPGFFRMTRRALERIVLEKPFLAFMDRDNPQGHRSWMFFDNACRQTGVYDEGYIFCEHWRSCGGTCYLDPDLEFGHIGFKEYRPDHKTVRGWLTRKTETLEKLYHEHPNIPPLLLARKAMGEEVNLEEEAKKLKDVPPPETTEEAIKQLQTMSVMPPSRVYSGIGNTSGEAA